MAARCSSPSFKHDIFFSFRGKDVRKKFISHLNKGLCFRGFSTFIDDEMERGQVISSALVSAIKNSMCSIVVLSENYASSRWCLEELVTILECKREKGQRVIPIFYDIDPSDVRYQRGKIGEAMAKHERNLKENMVRDAATEVANLSGWDSSNQEKIGEAMAKHERKLKEDMERVQIWRDALTEVANTCGWDARNHKNEAMLIEEIIQSILEGMYKDWGKSVDGGRGAIMARIQLNNRRYDLIEKNLERAAISMRNIRASMRSGSPNVKAIMRDLIRLTAEMMDLSQFTRETVALIPSRLPVEAVAPLGVDKKLFRSAVEAVAPLRVEKRLFRSRMDEEVRSISSDHVGEDSKGQGKLSTISGCKNLSIKFRTSIKARLLGLTWSTTIKARLRAEQVLIVLHYVNDSIVSSYTNASILILVVGSWNLLYVLFLQSCEDVFHGSPVTIFCELKLSDLRSCEVGCFGNPLNWGDGVVRGIIPAEVEGEEAGKGKP